MTKKAISVGRVLRILRECAESDLEAWMAIMGIDGPWVRIVEETGWRGPKPTLDSELPKGQTEEHEDVS